MGVFRPIMLLWGLSCLPVLGPEDEVATPRVENIVATSVEGVCASGNNVEASTSVPDADSPTGDFYDSQTVETATADNVYVPEWNVTNGAQVDNPALCRNFLDHVTPPGYWAVLRNQSAASFLDAFNINSAQHTCMVIELCLRYEHEVMIREKFQKKFTDNCAVVQQRKEKIAALRARLEEAEREAAKVVALRHHVFELEVGVIVKSQDIDTLSKQNAKLLSKVYALESECKELNRHVIKLGGDCEHLQKEVVGEAKLREEFKSFLDVDARRFEQRSAELDASIVDVKHDIDNDLYPHMFTAIAGRRWILSHGVRLAVMKCAQSTEFRSALGKVISLEINKGIEEGLEARIEHGKSGQTLDRVEAYNPEFKDEFVSAITDFENVSFALLDELESLKDSPLASITSALVLQDAQGNVDSTPKLQRFQPSLDQVTVPIYSKSGSVSGEMFLSEVIPTAHAAAEKRGLCPPLLGGTSSSAPPHGSSLGVADYQVSTLVLSGDG
ncbi:hypothetical protein Tco_0992237 [Tanacetum coccineum]|uniref:Uncharacterized protein n=1 Tax=Tanacetum coccineum TaxID=301880 RepID=A0ABQ5F2B0_9ASTR